MFIIEGEKIIEMTKLEGNCGEPSCGDPAKWRVVISNDKPPPGYIKGGSLVRHYCSHHLPKSAADFWDQIAKPD